MGEVIQFPGDDFDARLDRIEEALRLAQERIQHSFVQLRASVHEKCARLQADMNLAIDAAVERQQTCRHDGMVAHVRDDDRGTVISACVRCGAELGRRNIAPAARQEGAQ